MVIVGHGGVVENGGGRGGARVLEDEMAGRRGIVGGAGDSFVQLLDEVGLILGPGNVEPFFGEEAWDASLPEAFFMIDLWAG